jgi:lambda family phage portal protein
MGASLHFTPAQAYPLDRATVKAIGGAYEGASRFSRELATWRPASLSPDQELNRDKETLDARLRDMVRNDGYAHGAVATHRDSIVGGMYRVNAQPDWKVLGADDTWAEEFQEWSEKNFTLWAESPDNWPDASRLNTLTGLVRMVVGLGVLCGESLSTVEWLRSSNERRPSNTAFQMIHLDRLSNPNDTDDTAFIRRGVERDRYGAPVAVHIRSSHPSEWYSDNPAAVWKRVPMRKPWGRLQVIHIFEQMQPDQSRGVSSMVSVLKEMKMTKSFRDVVLQNAVVNATYAAAIESELPTDTLWEQLGMGTGDNGVERYLTALADYTGGAKNLHIDGVKIPHLFPGTKLNLKPMGTPGGVGTDFEQALLRYVAASLGLSYEQFSKDYTKTNYSSARASLVETWKYMQSRKKMFADRFATAVYSLWLEEQINAGFAPMPAGKTAAHFYEGLNKEAYCKCDWIGASRGQIDEYKETQAAVLRIKEGLSTFEEEISRSGKDFREVFAQQSREKALRKKLGIEIVATQIAVAEAGAKQKAAANDPAKDQQGDESDDATSKDDQQ